MDEESDACDTQDTPPSDHFEEIFRLAWARSSTRNCGRPSNSSRAVHAMGDDSTSSVACVPRGTDDDDNAMHIGQDSDLLRQLTHRIVYYSEQGLLVIK